VAVGIFFLGILLWGMAIGWIGQMLLGMTRSSKKNDWLQAIIAGGLGSLLGGTLGSLIAGEGFQIKMTGVVGSVIGAVAVLLIWNAVTSRSSKAS
jgi:uncharacterized membrane protein YeaQ/YmgE (transglycosylase-associated protein family)